MIENPALWLNGKQVLQMTNNTCQKFLKTLLLNLKMLIFCFSGINARAPPEPYYGRTIGQFTDFAHGIKVTSLVRLIHFEVFIGFSASGHRVCSWWVYTFYQGICVRRNGSRCFLLGRKFAEAIARRLHHPLPRRVHWPVSFPFPTPRNRRQNHRELRFIAVNTFHGRKSSEFCSERTIPRNMNWNNCNKSTQWLWTGLVSALFG